MRRLSTQHYRILKGTLFLLLLLPLGVLIPRALNAADPVEIIIRETGENALILLLLTLTITPLQRISGWNWLVKLRRMIGLYAFFYTLLHFQTYLLLDQQLDFPEIIKDILDRKYITVGFLAFLLLVPLALTSNSLAIRRLGATRWLRLHRLVYPIAILAVIHLLWQTKGDDLAEPILYAILLAVLLTLRHPAIATKTQRK